MPSDDPQWLQKLQAGDERAAQRLWEQYFQKLQRLANRGLGSLSRRAADEEDIALSALHSVMRGARKGRFPQLNDETDLWKVLVTVTLRKVSARRRRDGAKRRKPAGRVVHGESAFEVQGDAEMGGGIGRHAGNSPDANFIAEMRERCEELLDALGEPKLREVALLKLEGYTNDEIAEKLDYTCRTVERRLNTARERWEEHLQGQSNKKPY